MGTQVLVPYWYGTVQLFRYSTGIPYGTATVNPLENQGTLWFRINIYIFTTLWIGFGSGYIYLLLFSGVPKGLIIRHYTVVRENSAGFADRGDLG